jgi:hypothetical protein
MTNRIRIPALLAAAATVVLWTSAAAGPPLICHPVKIGGAQSLPWDGNSAARDYPSKSLVADTLRILGGDRSALVHMETLRRATLYIEKDRELALDLLSRLMGRALDAEADGKPDALAWFDAGYLVQCLQQNGLPLGLSSGEARGVAGYGWVRRALTLRPDDAELEFGAAMVTVVAGIPEHQQHQARAKALAKDGSLLAENLDNPALQHARQSQRGARG